MASDASTTEERLQHLLDALGIEVAHIAGSAAQDYRGFAHSFPQRVSTLALVSPGNVDSVLLGSLGERVLLIHGDKGPGSQVVPRALRNLPEATVHTLASHVDASWTDVIAQRGEAIAEALVRHISTAPAIPHFSPTSERGTIAGIRYEAHGSGPPLLLLPLGLAPSQWSPIIQRLSRDCCVLTLGGAALGMVAQLEERAESVWYQGMLRDLVAGARVEPGQRLLEVGCGSGTVSRWLARYTRGANPIVAVDINRYLLSEAIAITATEGLDGTIAFREGNAEELPLADGAFDATFCITVMEEGNADQMLRELVRVTRSGGAVATMVRSVDLPWWINVPVREEIKTKAARVASGGVAEHGCADASMAARMHRAGLLDVQICPRLATIEHGDRLQTALTRIRAILSSDEVEEWQVAVDRARRDGSLFIAQPFYCATGRTP
jgi:SAM-dependent methyltransferase